MKIIKTKIKPKNKKIFFIGFFLLFLSNPVLSNDDRQSNDYFKMPEMTSNSLVESKQPVLFTTQKKTIPRPLKIINEHDNFIVFFEKNTEITDRNGRIIKQENFEGELAGPLIDPPRKTLYLTAKIPPPSEKMLYSFLILFGNPCDESSKKKARKCKKPTEYFSPSARLEIPLPEDIKEKNLKVKFFDTKKWAWIDQRFLLEKNNSLLKVNLLKSGYIALVHKEILIKENTLIHSAKKDETIVKLPNNLQNQDFILKYFNTKNNSWHQRDYSFLNEKKFIKFKKPFSGVVAFFIKENNSNKVITKNNSNATSALFKDVKGKEWFAESIDLLIKKNVLQKDLQKNFNPLSLVNRAEAAKIICLAFDLPLSKKINLSDIKDNAWFAQYAQTVIDKGVMAAFLGNEFDSEALLSRGEAIFMAFQAGRIKLTDDFSGLKKIRDVEPKNAYAKEISFAVSSKIVKEKRRFFPKREVTRAEFVKIVSGVLRFIESADMEKLKIDFAEKLPEKVVLKKEEKEPFQKDFLNFESSNDIFRLKKALFLLGYFEGDFNTKFDNNLEKALKKFQLEKKIFSNEKVLGVGRFGSSTRKTINKLIKRL